MKRKQWFPLMMTMVLVLGVTGCSKDTKEKEPEEVTNEVTITQEAEPSPTVEVTPEVEKEEIQYTEEDLKVLSEELATQVADGDCSEVSHLMIDSIQSTYTPEVLEDAIKKGVSTLGEFVSIESSAAQTTDEELYVAVILRYENSGLQLLFGYNQDIRITTFYYTYVSLDDDMNSKSDKYEEVAITVGAGEYQMDGIMTIPVGVEKPPVVILVQGSGQTDMDETVGACSNKPFRDIARGLGEQGIATIRYNKRYYQFKDSLPEEVTVEDEILDDVGAAIILAQKSDVLDTSRIYVAGHSEGGMLAPKIASDHPELAGIIMLAGSPRHLEDIIYDQAVFFAEKEEDLPESEKELYLNMMKTNVEQVKNLTDENLSEPILGFNGYYWKSLNSIDTPAIVKELKIPMLILQGSADFQVYPDIDFLAWQNILQGHENATLIEYDGLNHLFMPTNGIQNQEDYDTKNEVDSKVITDIAEWISKN